MTTFRNPLAALWSADPSLKTAALTAIGLPQHTTAASWVEVSRKDRKMQLSDRQLQIVDNNISIRYVPPRPPLNIGGRGQNVDFRTTLEFDREHLWNGTRYQLLCC